MGVNIWTNLCHIDSIITQTHCLMFQSDGLLEYLLILKLFKFNNILVHVNKIVHEYNMVAW